MTLEMSVLLLLLALTGLCAAPRLWSKKPGPRRACRAVCAVLALLSGGYIALTLLFVWAAGQKP